MKLNKIFFMLISVLGVCFAYVAYSANDEVAADNTQTNKFATKIYISKVIDHPALDLTTKGIIDGLEKFSQQTGLKLDIKVESAQGSSVLAAQIANKFINQKVDIAVAVGTISAQSFLKYVMSNRMKLIFSSVSEPAKAGLVAKDLLNVTGVSNFIELEPQLALFKQLQPNLKTLGVIYNPGELNSVLLLEKLNSVAMKFNIKVISQVAMKTADVAQASSTLIPKVDAIFVNNDNTALSAIQSIIKFANNSKIPVYVSDIALVKNGALAALGPDQYKLGLQTADLIIKVINKQSINIIQLEYPKSKDILINTDVLNMLGFSIPTKLQKNVTKVVTEKK